LQIDIVDLTGIGQFCAQLEEIFNSQEGANRKSFKFTLLANPNKWIYDENEMHARGQIWR
jgi:hypothetical protein